MWDWERVEGRKRRRRERGRGRREKRERGGKKGEEGGGKKEREGEGGREREKKGRKEKEKEKRRKGGEGGKKKGEGNGSGGVVIASVMVGTRTEYKREILIILWTALMLVGVWLVGLLIAIPLGILVYFFVLDRGSWRRALISGVLMYLVIYFVFVRLLSTQLPHGIF